MKRSRLLPCLLLTTMACGCFNQIRDEFDDMRVAIFTHKLAWAAYRESAPCFAAVGCKNSFRLGFEAGFTAVANGGNGCPPIFPPNTKIMSLAWLDDASPEERRDAWYDGYSQGVLAAYQTGAEDINRIPARLPRKQVYDLSTSPAGPSEFSPLLPSPLPTPMPIDNQIPPVSPAPEDY